MGSARPADKELTDVETPISPDSPRSPSRQERLAELLNASFAPTAFEVIDESGKHKGHAGAAPGGQTHYRVRMTSAAFAGMSRLARQRAALEAVKAEFASGLHALALELKAPGE
jgi:BolA protein